MQDFDSVLLIAFGGPTRPEEIRPFLENVTRGRRIPADRLESVVHHYEAIGGFSPLNAITERQAAGVAERLRARGCTAPVFIGMRNWHPYLHETIGRMADAGLKRACGLILSAQQSEAGWERYQQDVRDAQERVGAAAPTVDFVPEWHALPGFIAAVAAGVRATLDRIPSDRRDAAKLIFTAHSIPTSMGGVDGYVAQVQHGAELAAAGAGVSQWQIAYQSRSGSPRDPWLEPDICDVVREHAAHGTRDLVVSPIGFIADHAEVLYDLDIEAKQVADECRIGFHRAPAVNDHPLFLDGLTDLVLR